MGVFVLTLLSGPFMAKGQVILGARSLGMGQAVTALPESPWSLYLNPAMLPGERQVAFYGIQNYRLPELMDVSAVIVNPFSFGTMALGHHRYGNDLFNKHRTRLGYKYEWRGVHAGLVLNYSHVSISNYGNDGAIGVDLGVAASPFENLWFGASANNINRPKIGTELPRRLTIGFSYRMVERVTATSEVVKDVQFPVAYRGGLEVEMVDNFFARTGITTEPTTYSFGLGLLIAGRYAVNLAVQHHELLSWSPGLDVLLKW